MIGLLLKFLQMFAESNQDECAEAPVLPGHMCQLLPEKEDLL